MANNKIQVKRTTVSGRQPNTTGSYATNSQYIAAGEFALNMADGILYTSNGSAVIPIGANNVNINVTGNATIKAIIANGSIGTAGHVLHSNGSAIYWAADDNAGGTVTSVATGNGLTGGPITATGTVSVLANTGIVANATGLYVNATYIGTLSANNASFLGGTAASGYQTTAGLSANVATLTSNNSTFAFGKTEGALNVNSALTSNNSSFLGGTAAASYQLNSTLNANIASYLPTYTGTVNGSIFSVGTSFIANSTGVYHTGIINATTISTGSVNVINASGLTTTANVSIGSAGDLVVTAGAGIFANGGLGTAGQVLASNGSSIYWSTVSGGASLTANNTSTATFFIPMANTTSGSWSNGVVANTKLYFVPSTGTLSATVFNSLSDIEYKTNIETIQNSLDIVNELRGVTFNWKENNRPSVGVIAQEVEKVIPELVTEHNNKKSVNYDGLIGILIEAIKELKQEIQDLKSQK